MLATMLVSRLPVFATVNLSGYLLENADDRCLRASAIASVLGLAGLAAAGMVAIPALGAVGALAALGVMDLVQAAGLRALTASVTTAEGAGTPMRVAVDPSIPDMIAMDPPTAGKSVTLRSHDALSQRKRTPTPTPVTTMEYR